MAYVSSCKNTFRRFLVPKVPLTVILLLFFCFTSGSQKSAFAQDVGPVIRINEVMPAPSAGEVEFIELFVPEPDSVSWSGVRVRDQSGSWKTIQVQFPLPRNAYIVLVKSISASEHLFPMGTHLGAISSWPALNNNGDSLFVEVNGRLVDKMGWKVSQAGVSWERKSPFIPGYLASNWSLSTAPIGSTPGLINSQHVVDITAPTLVAAELRRPDSLVVWFSEPLPDGERLHVDLLTDGRVVYSGSIPITNDFGVLLPPQHIITALLNESSALFIPHLTDYAGNVSQNQLEPIYWPPTINELRITEVLPYSGGHLRQDRIPEYVKISSTSKRYLSLSDVSLGVDGTYFRVADRTKPAIIRPFESVIVTSTNWNGWNDLHEDNESWFDAHRDHPFLRSYRKYPFAFLVSQNLPLLPNTLALLELKSPDHPIDSTVYEANCHDPRFNTLAGRSFIRLVDSRTAATGTACSWTSNLSPWGATPSWILTDDSNPDDRANGLPPQASIAVTEVLADPLINAFDFKADQTEFIELVNTSGRRIPLHTLWLTTPPDEHGQRSVWPLTTTPVWLDPTEIAVIFSIPPSFQDQPLEEHSLLQEAWPDLLRQEESDRTVVFLPTRKLPSLGKSGGFFEFIDPFGEPIATLTYSQSDHYAGLLDTEGHSLFKPLTNRLDGSQTWHYGPWTTSFSAGGATPGWIPDWKLGQNTEENGETAATEQAASFSLTAQPKSFYPNHIHLDHETMIVVQTPHQGAFVRLDVFDAQGYQVSSIAQARFVEHGWSQSWSGTDANGNLLAAGIYIVVATFKDAQGATKRVLKTPVALLRR